MICCCCCCHANPLLHEGGLKFPRKQKYELECLHNGLVSPLKWREATAQHGRGDGEWWMADGRLAELAMMLWLRVLDTKSRKTVRIVPNRKISQRIQENNRKNYRNRSKKWKCLTNP